MFGDNYKRADFVTVVTGEPTVLGNRQRDILTVQGQPVASGRLALSCCDNSITSPTSRQCQQMATSSYRSYLSLQPCIHPQMLSLKWRSGAQRAGVTLKRGRRVVGPSSRFRRKSLTGPALCRTSLKPGPARQPLCAHHPSRLLSVKPPCLPHEQGLR